MLEADQVRVRTPDVGGGFGATIGTSPEEILLGELAKRIGRPVRWTETRSRDTRSNARETAALLMPMGITRVLLIAHSFDMPRAVAEFDSAGLRVIAAPTAVIGDQPADGHPLDWLPGIAPLYGSYFALYELLAGIARVLP